MTRKLGLLSSALLMIASTALADDVVWARREVLGVAGIFMAANGQLYCTGCNGDNPDRVFIQRGPGVSSDVTRFLDVWMSTHFAVLFRVDQGNSCSGDFYTISLLSHRLEHLDTSRFQCGDFDISVSNRDTMTITMSDKRGHRQVAVVR